MESAAASASRASSAIVWWRKIEIGVRFRPAPLACMIVRKASRESPPRSKKLSSTPSPSTPSRSSQIRARVSSAAVPGATRSVASSGRSRTGSGSLARSTFLLAVSGNASRVTKAAGIMYSGRLSRRYARRSVTVLGSAPLGSTYATSRLGPPSVLRASDDAVLDRGVPRQDRLDLAELDPEAPDLDLEVRAAKELDPPVGAAAHDVTGPVETTLRSRRRTRRSTNRSVVRSGRSR